ncbi:MAG TPA: porin, partial [Planctomycetaceae bacterium]|nr:porin [Planctomycetaceae bacterium]
MAVSVDRRLLALLILLGSAAAGAGAAPPQSVGQGPSVHGHTTHADRQAWPDDVRHGQWPAGSSSVSDQRGLADSLWLTSAARFDAVLSGADGACVAEDDESEAKKKWYEKYKLRGYAQFRYNETTELEEGSAPAQHAGDSSVGPEQTFLLRRARLIFSGDMTEHLFVYLQPDFATTPPGSPDANHFVQIRDWYADVYVDTEKVYRFRVGQSKVPYGWENLQSSSNRVPLDRNDAFNSATRNERDLGVFFYWTPEWTQDLFDEIMDEGLKGSGNYGLFGIGAYVGQGGSFQEQNDNLHVVARFTYPWELSNGQIIEAGVQGYTGEYVVLGSPIRPLGLGAADLTPDGTLQRGDRD